MVALSFFLGCLLLVLAGREFGLLATREGSLMQYELRAAMLLLAGVYFVIAFGGAMVRMAHQMA
jgi:hypothetical protein